MERPETRPQAESDSLPLARLATELTSLNSESRQLLPSLSIPPAVETISFGPRPSRASSVISTRTGLTIGTLQEEARSIRSVDLVIGGKLFHINRDASKISVLEQNDLPAYSSPPPLSFLDGVPRAVVNSEHVISSSTPLHEAINREHGPTATGNEQTVERSLSFYPGPDKLCLAKKRSASQGNIPERAYSHFKALSLPLRRRNGVRLPKLSTEILQTTSISAEEAEDIRATRSAEPRICSSGYPVNIGQNAIGSFPHSFERTASPEEARGLGDSLKNNGSNILIPESPVRIEEHHADGTAPPSMDSENDISIHYTRLIRSIDREHRKALHIRDKELAAMRERLNELDQVYRKELKLRDFTIDDLRQRLEHLEKGIESQIQTVRNEVEEQWEHRWKVRDRHYMERMKRMELDFQGRTK
ncbi:hypothetical protein LOZ65_004391 [Ophidiomyces ophidiicola]|nr:hypothetical protein LOZ65_004391 [Ophidiomyces ophidiicola]